MTHLPESLPSVATGGLQVQSVFRYRCLTHRIGQKEESWVHCFCRAPREWRRGGEASASRLLQDWEEDQRVMWWRKESGSHLPEFRARGATGIPGR